METREASKVEREEQCEESALLPLIRHKHLMFAIKQEEEERDEEVSSMRRLQPSNKVRAGRSRMIETHGCKTGTRTAVCG